MNFNLRSKGFGSRTIEYLNALKVKANNANFLDERSIVHSDYNKIKSII